MAITYGPDAPVKVTDVLANVTSTANGYSQDVQDSLTKILDAVAGTDGVTLGIMNSKGQIVDPDGNVIDTGAQVITVPNDVTLTSLPADADITAILMGQEAVAKVSFAADSQVQAIVLGNSANNVVAFNNDKVNATVATGTGKGTQVYTAGGNDLVSINGAKSGTTVTVDTGEGNDTVQFANGNASDVQVTSGSGNLVVDLATKGSIVATVDAGEGFDRLNVTNGTTLANHEIVYDAEAGGFVMHSNGALTLQNVNLVTFDTIPDGKVTWQDGVSVLASNWEESIIAKLYNVALGRSVIDGKDGVIQKGGTALSGIEFWDDYIDTHPGVTNQQLVYSFLNCNQFHNATDALSNAKYLNYLYKNLGLSTSETVTDAQGNSVTYQDFLNTLNTAGATSAENMNARYDAAWKLADSQTTVEILGADGKMFVIDGDFGDTTA